jgi:hypothetical protein
MYVSHVTDHGVQWWAEICVLLGNYAASCGNCLPTFRDNVSVPSVKMGPITTRRYVISQKSADLINIVAEA